jgi:hypothetical protein
VDRDGRSADLIRRRNDEETDRKYHIPHCRDDWFIPCVFSVGNKSLGNARVFELDVPLTQQAKIGQY